MKKNKLVIPIMAVTLSLSMLGQPVRAAEDTAYTKNENVYTKLSADGTVANPVYVVNSFEVDNDTTITDYGSYMNIKNLTNLDDLTQQDKAVTFSVETGKFYYQGDLTESELPWILSITYTLDGKVMDPEELGGASGSLEIHVTTRQNTKVDTIFYDNYVMQISFTLDGIKCSNIQADNSTISDAGADKSIAFTVLPGSDGDFRLQSEVTDFEMSGISIAAVPYSMSIDTKDLGIDDMTEQFTQLTDAVADLNEGTKQLKDGINEVDDGGDSLLSGSSQINYGLNTLSSNSATLTDASAQINDALALISNQLSSSDMSSLDSLNQLPQVLTQLADALDQLQNGMVQLESGFTSSYQALDAVISSSQSSQLTNDELTALETAAADSGNLEAYQKLKSSYDSLNAIQVTYDQVKPAFQSVTSALDGSNSDSLVSGLTQTKEALQQMTSQMSASLSGINISEMMSSLQDGLSTLSANYAQFHTGVSEYTAGVSTLASGYEEYQNGLTTYLDGISQLNSGTGEFADGMDQFADETADLPQQMQDTVDEMLEKYNSADFDAISFVDAKNVNINSVQFILTTDEITAPDEEVTEEEESQEGFWDRLKNLF